MSKTIDVKPIDVSIASEEEKQSVVAYNEAVSIEIKDQAIYEKAGELRSRIRSRLKWFEDARKSITQPLDQAKKAVMDLFRSPTQRYEQALEAIDRAMIRYDDDQEKKSKAEEDRLAREAEKKRQENLKKAEAARAEGKEDKATRYEEKASNIITPSLASTAEKPKGIQYRDQWKCEVVDFEKHPNDYKLPDMMKLNKVAQATKGSLNIPGVIFKKEKIVASRAA